MLKNVFICIFLGLDKTLHLKNHFFSLKISPFQNLKVAIYKGFKILERQKYPKIRVLNCRFFENLNAKKGTFRAFLGYS